MILFGLYQKDWLISSCYIHFSLRSSSIFEKIWPGEIERSIQHFYLNLAAYALCLAKLYCCTLVSTSFCTLGVLENLQQPHLRRGLRLHLFWPFLLRYIDEANCLKIFLKSLSLPKINIKQNLLMQIFCFYCFSFYFWS